MSEWFGLNLIVFAAIWIFLVYVYDSYISRAWIKVVFSSMILYVTTVAFIGVYGEIFLDTIYKFFVGTPLWHYNILPIHNAYTSTYAPIIWGILGFHMYLSEQYIRRMFPKWRARHRALLFAAEALLLEAALTLMAKFFFGDLMYYYYPGDLWHVTSFQNLPFYFVCGILIEKTLRVFTSKPYFFIGMTTLLTIFVVIFV